MAGRQALRKGSLIYLSLFWLPIPARKYRDGCFQEFSFKSIVFSKEKPLPGLTSASSLVFFRIV
jgi:hypothetical protein